MSTRQDHYVLWGLAIPYADVEYEQIEKWRAEEIVGPYVYAADTETPVGVLYDGMGGNYVYVGAVLAKGDDVEGFPEPVALPDFSMTIIANEHGMHGQTIPTFAAWKNKIADILNQLGLLEKMTGAALQWHVVTHYR